MKKGYTLLQSGMHGEHYKNLTMKVSSPYPSTKVFIHQYDVSYSKSDYHRSKYRLVMMETHQTLNPSTLRHCRCASMYFPQAPSPCCTMQSSLNFFVSGQARQIFFFGFVSGAGDGAASCCAESDASVFTDVEFPISEMNRNIIRSGTGRPIVDYIHQ
jgi:hypothetical protein